MLVFRDHNNELICTKIIQENLSITMFRSVQCCQLQKISEPQNHSSSILFSHPFINIFKIMSHKSMNSEMRCGKTQFVCAIQLLHWRHCFSLVFLSASAEQSVLPFDNHQVPTPLPLPCVCLSHNSSFWQHQSTNLTPIILLLTRLCKISTSFPLKQMLHGIVITV